MVQHPTKQVSQWIAQRLIKLRNLWPVIMPVASVCFVAPPGIMLRLLSIPLAASTKVLLGLTINASTLLKKRWLLNLQVVHHIPNHSVMPLGSLRSSCITYQITLSCPWVLSGPYAPHSLTCFHTCAEPWEAPPTHTGTRSVQVACRLSTHVQPTRLCHAVQVTAQPCGSAARTRRFLMSPPLGARNGTCFRNPKAPGVATSLKQAPVQPG